MSPKKEKNTVFALVCFCLGESLLLPSRQASGVDLVISPSHVPSWAIGSLRNGRPRKCRGPPCESAAAQTPHRPSSPRRRTPTGCLSHGWCVPCLAVCFLKMQEPAGLPVSCRRLTGAGCLRLLLLEVFLFISSSGCSFQRNKSPSTLKKFRQRAVCRPM